MSGSHNIVVLGGSYAGLSAAHYFLKHVQPTLPKDGNYKVILVNPSTHFYHRVASPRAAASYELMPNSKTFHDIAAGFKQYSPDVFAFVQGKATSLDTTERTVTVKRTEGAEETISYHALILATGTKTYAPQLSLQGGSHQEIQTALSDMHTQLKSAKSIVVAGGGPAGVETAGEIGEFLNGAPGFFSSKLAKLNVPITLYTGGDKLLPILRPAISKQAQALLERVGVNVVYNTKITGTEKLGSGKTKVVFESGKETECDLYIPAMGVIPMSEYVPKDLLTDKGYVKTNETTLRVDGAGPRVFAVGDVGSYTRGGVIDIFDAIPVVLTNLKRDLLAAHSDPNAKPKGGDRPYKANRSETQLVPVGQSKGVGAFNGNKLPSVMVWGIKGRDYMSGTATQIVTGTRWNKEVGWKPTDG